MANRHLSRSIVMQTLFECDFRGLESKEAKSVLDRNALEFGPGLADPSFMESLLENVIKKKKELDKIISKAAPDWPLEKISVADRNVLRLGLAELLFSDRNEVPAKVAINEAIELAKTFGGENSGKFVNGVLGSVYKELGEPGKDEKPRKKKMEAVPFEKMPIERLGGGVVFAKERDDVFLALVHDIFGHWTLPKGHLVEGEEVISGTERVVGEEISLPVKSREKLGDNEYVASDPEKGKIRKQVSYFLLEAKYGELGKSKSGGLDDIRWFRLRDILDLNFYNDILPIVTKAVKLLSEGKV